MITKGNSAQALERAHLGSVSDLCETASDGKSSYVATKRRSASCIHLFLLRRALSGMVIRGEGAETLRTRVPGLPEERVCAPARKFKYGDRRHGLEILRLMGAGGRYHQNRTAVPVSSKKDLPGQAFDLNSVLFGDSAQGQKRVYPVKAAVSYSDALSFAPVFDAEDSRFGIMTQDDTGTLFDPVSKENSNNIRTDYFVRPGTAFIQVLSIGGAWLPPEGFEHLLACLGTGGAGGSTSVHSVNMDTTFLGASGFPLELPTGSAYHLLRRIEEAGFGQKHPEFAMRHSTEEQARLSETIRELVEDEAKSRTKEGSRSMIWVGADEMEAWRSSVLEGIVTGAEETSDRYLSTARALEDYFQKVFA